MSEMENEESKQASRQAQEQAQRNCAPLYILDRFLRDGCDASTRNATATFLHFKDQYYACTCRHVVEIARNRRSGGYSPFAGLALGYKQGFEPLSFFTALQDATRVVPAADGEEYLNLAIADITLIWPRFSADWGSRAIEMDPDRWHEPRWARADMLAAAGWPETGKRNATDDKGMPVVNTTMAFAVANLKGGLSRSDRIVMMESRLDAPHGWFFSGISGGPIYIIQDNKLVPVGLLYDGWPQQKGDEHEKYNECDIVIRGVVLTPEHLERWLKAAGFEAAAES
jgi:hypothetical protein